MHMLYTSVTVVLSLSSHFPAEAVAVYVGSVGSGLVVFGSLVGSGVSDGFGGRI